MNVNTKSIVVLTVICLVVAVALAGVNFITAPIIAEADAAAAFEACFKVMPTASDFENVDLTDGLPATVTSIYKETTGQGYAVKITTKGYETGLVILCGIDSEGRITGTTIVSGNETPSIGGQCGKPAYSDQYLGLGDDLSSVEGISGATLTSTAYKSAVSDALKAVSILEGRQ